MQMSSKGHGNGEYSELCKCSVMHVVVGNQDDEFAQMYSFYWFIFMQHLIIIIEQHI